jgi:ABC-2 type transport system permease protein
LRSTNIRHHLSLASTIFGYEVRKLIANRAFWILLLVLCPLLGYSFVQAIDLFSAASRTATERPELAGGMTTLDGILVPTMGAFYLATTLLFPFVAIRALGHEKQTGALKLAVQLPVSETELVVLKLGAVCFVWALSLAPAISAIVFWRCLGGFVNIAELANLVLGHALYAAVIASVALFAAAVTDSVSTGAIITLAFTLGFWVLDFTVGSQGGPFASLASLSPTAVLRECEHGWFSLPQIAQSGVLALCFTALAVAWLPSGVISRRKIANSAIILGASTIIFAGVANARFYADVTVDRRNSFNPVDETALRQMKEPLNITVYLSPEDSRLREMESNVLAKVRRIIPRVYLRYGAVPNVGQFGAPADDRYGLITYEYQGRHQESRSNSFREILPILHQLAGVTVTPVEAPAFSGHPLDVDATPAAWWFYGILPASIIGSWYLTGRLSRSSKPFVPPSPRKSIPREPIMNKSKKTFLFSAVGLMILPIANINAAEAMTIDLSQEKVGAEPSVFTAVVGKWSIGTPENNKKVLVVDGTKWASGQASAGLADKARALYGERYAEFLDNVTAYAFFPIAILKSVDDFRGGEISLRFEGVSGRIDQAAGIIFNVKPNGDYLILRANCLENNLVLFKYEHGKRSQIEWTRNTPTPSRQWHDLKLEVSGKHVKGFLDSKLYVEHDLPSPVSGKIGVWSKADSVVYFDDYRVVKNGP